jgi:hypothetical protein
MPPSSRIVALWRRQQRPHSPTQRDRLATDTPSDVERFDDFLEYLVTVGFADEPYELR